MYLDFVDVDVRVVSHNIKRICDFTQFSIVVHIVRSHLPSVYNEVDESSTMQVTNLVVWSRHNVDELEKIASSPCFAKESILGFQRIATSAKVTLYPHLSTVMPWKAVNNVGIIDTLRLVLVTTYSLIVVNI